MSSNVNRPGIGSDEPMLHFRRFDSTALIDGLLVCRKSLSLADRDALESLAFKYACVPESYDIAVSDGHILQTPCGQGVMSVLTDGRFWHIAGSILGPESIKPQMIQWLKEISDSRKKTIAVYNVSEAEARIFQDHGFKVNKFGEEPILDVSQVNWSGKKYEWVRRQSNFCLRAGVDITEITDAEEQSQLAETMVEIMSEDFAGRTLDKPLRLLEGEFNPHALQRRRLFVARAATGPVEAFVGCSPIDGGRSWAFETYRKRKDATQGVTAHLFRTIIDRLKDEGADYVSLCLIPGRNVETSSIVGGDWRIQKALSIWFNRLDFVFNVKGQDHFKSRFRPQYLDRYMCVVPRYSVSSVWSFLRTTGAMNFNARNLFGQIRRGFFR